MEKQIRLLKTGQLFCCCLLLVVYSYAQNTIPVFKGATKANRDKTYNYILKTAITENLSVPLTDSTEENWEEAFYAAELIHYKESWINEKIKTAFVNFDERSFSFQRALLELCYSNFPVEYKDVIHKVLLHTGKAKIFAMAAEYLTAQSKVQSDRPTAAALFAAGLMRMPVIKMLDSAKSSIALLDAMQTNFRNEPDKDFNKKIKDLFRRDYLPGNTIIYSIQRKNRNYTGIVVVRDKAGNFINDSGKTFFVPQLARSVSTLPYYLTNGNTPQGIFRLYGFDVSKSPALGPTENLQLTMPFETSIQHFLKDSSITYTVWTPELYKKLLPASLKNYGALSQTYYASLIGRTEIIAHGTTVDPDFYKGQTYYPYTPTQGCLCTKEIWSALDGKRLISDQQKLVDAVKKAGGPDGYLIVIEIDDQQKPLSIAELLPYLK
jgi:hypothetical protein